MDALAAVVSDHSAIRLILCESKGLIRGPSYWKFNSILVNDKIYVENLNNEVTQYTNETTQMIDPRARWDFLKLKIKVFSKKYSIEKAKARKARRHVLENKLQQLEFELSADQNNVSIEKYENVKAVLDQIYNYITEGSILRAKCDWHEHGEKSSKHFLNLARRNKAKSNIQSLYRNNKPLNKPSMESKPILNELKSFYQNLYTRRSCKTENECLTYLKDLNTPQLTEEESNLCEGSLTLQECYNANEGW